MASQSNYRILKRSQPYCTEGKKLWNIWCIQILVTMIITRIGKKTYLCYFNVEVPIGPRIAIICTSLNYTREITVLGWGSL